MDLNQTELERKVTKLNNQLNLTQTSIQQLKSEATQHAILASLAKSVVQSCNQKIDEKQSKQNFLQKLVALTQSRAVFVLIYDAQSANFALEEFLHSHLHISGQLHLEEMPIQATHQSTNITTETIIAIQKFTGCDCFYWHFDPSANRVMLLANDLQGSQSETFFKLDQRIAELALELYNDVLTQKQYEEKIAVRASSDPLTGLPNRTVAFDRLGRAMIHRTNPEKMVFTLFIDIARFKDINEAHGHDVGDEILKIVSNRLKSSVRETDTISALGGDEFLVILENANKAKAAQVVADKIIESLSSPVYVKDIELLLGCNIGISAYPGDGHDASTLIRNADAAMYDARKLGINRFRFFTHEMNQEVAERMALEKNLYKAVENDQFSLNFQPVFDCETQEIHGAEALLRWKDSELGNVSPATFIPIAEEDGLIVPIGQWVIESAISTLATWHRSGHTHLHMAINISVRQLIELDFVSKLETVCAKNGISPTSVELEVTEGILLTNENGEADVIRQLAKRGFRLSMDDFGTGYSALSYLNDFHFNYLKIDRSFIMRMTESQRDQTLVKAIIAMAHMLEMKVIAEGAETSAALEFLKEQRCDFVQGFACGRPMTESNFTALLANEPVTA